MLSPEEQAFELVVLFQDKINGIRKELAKKQALLAVDVVFKFMEMDDEYTGTVSNANSKWVNYWQEVKQEIEKL